MVGVGEKANLDELQALASDPLDFNVIQAGSWSDLQKMVPNAITGLCNGEFLACSILEPASRSWIPSLNRWLQ